MKRREKQRRSDTKERQSLIKRARIKIFNKGRSVAGAAVDALLKAKSWVPTTVSSPHHALTQILIDSTQNAFSKLFKFGMDIHRVLVVDLLHDWWLGVWKSTFIHLIRILHCRGLDVVSELDTRYVAPVVSQPFFSTRARQVSSGQFVWAKHIPSVYQQPL
jgi:hypothetical protein